MTNLTFEDALRVARECLTYSGNYRYDDARYEIFQQGVETVVNALVTVYKSNEPKEPML